MLCLTCFCSQQIHSIKHTTQEIMTISCECSYKVADNCIFQQMWKQLLDILFCFEVHSLLSKRDGICKANMFKCPESYSLFCYVLNRVFQQFHRSTQRKTWLLIVTKQLYISQFNGLGYFKSPTGRFTNIFLGFDSFKHCHPFNFFQPILAFGY